MEPNEVESCDDARVNSTEEKEVESTFSIDADRVSSMEENDVESTNTGSMSSDDVRCNIMDENDVEFNISSDDEARATSMQQNDVQSVKISDDDVGADNIMSLEGNNIESSISCDDYIANTTNTTNSIEENEVESLISNDDDVESTICSDYDHESVISNDGVESTNSNNNDDDDGDYGVDADDDGDHDADGDGDEDQPAISCPAVHTIISFLGSSKSTKRPNTLITVQEQQPKQRRLEPDEEAGTVGGDSMNILLNKKGSDELARSLVVCTGPRGIGTGPPHPPEPWMKDIWIPLVYVLMKPEPWSDKDEWQQLIGRVYWVPRVLANSPLIHNRIKSMEHW